MRPKFLVTVTAFLFIVAQQAVCDANREKPMSNAHTYISAFKRGEDFSPPAKGVFVNNQPDSEAVELLGRELATANASVRENIVELLVDMGLQTDALKPMGAEVLRNRRIMEILADAGMAKADIGREATMDALRKLVVRHDLVRLSDAFAQALEDSPTEEAFLLVAKAKPPNAKTLVEKLAKSPEWKGVEAARIARAALGDKDVEDGFLKIASDAVAARDGKALAHALGTLALIGTPRSLTAIAEQLRTPLTIEIPGAFEKSVRLNVLEALLYNFPDQTVLYPNNIIKESDYTEAERFCTMTLGVTYKYPPPPFMTYRGHPF